MPVKYNREIIANGIALTTITDPKFKTNSVVIRFVTPLCEDTVSANVISAQLVTTTNKNYKTRTELSKKLASLYGSAIYSGNFKYGDNQVVSVNAGFILDSLALEGEKISAEVTSLLLDCIFNPVVVNGGFDEKEFEIRRSDLIDAIEAEINEKRSYAISQANKTICRGEPNAISAYGTVDGVKSLTPKTAYEQYLKLLKTAQIEITVAGGGDFQPAVDEIKNAFVNAQREFNKEIKYASKSPLKSKTENVCEQMDVNQCKMVMAFKSDNNDIFANKLMSAILGGTAFSKLFVNVREKLSLCYYCASGFREDKSVLLIDSGVEKKNIELAKAEILKQIGELASGNFTEDEIVNTKKYYSSSVRSDYDSVSSMVMWYFHQIARGTMYSPDEYIELINNVSREQIVKSAQSLKLDTVYVMEGSDEGGECDE